MHDIKSRGHDWLCNYKFMKWGISYFIFGLLLGFGVLFHYLTGAKWDNSQSFLRNITLWFGSPLSFSVAYLQLGGLGMAVVGAAKLLIAHVCYNPATNVNATSTPNMNVDTVHRKKGMVSLVLCHLGLIALFLTGYLGYFIIDSIWPGFYYGPITQGKNLWLILQGLSILCYFIGLLGAFNSLRKCCHQCGKHSETRV